MRNIHFKHTFLAIGSLIFMGNTLMASSLPQVAQPQPEVLSSESISLENRAVPGSFMAEVMRDNILLTVAYMRGEIRDKGKIDWEAVRKPFEYSFELKPGEAYSFQRDSLPEYQDSIVKTIDVNFAGQDGFKHDGYLMGDGVCHLASLFYKAALKANIEAVAPANHNFMPIPEIEREYGVAIYSMPGNPEANAKQNLYIRNDTSGTIKFEIKYDGEKIEAKVVKTKAVLNNLTQEVI
jgi:hypothetical protein